MLRLRQKLTLFVKQESVGINVLCGDPNLLGYGFDQLPESTRYQVDSCAPGLQQVH